MTARKLKWVGLGDSEYVSREGAFLVQLRDRTWHLHSRVVIDVAGLPSWTWSASLFSDKRKGACQDAAEKSPKAKVSASAENTSNGPKGALTNFDAGDETTNARCYDCGVAFHKLKNWQYGDLCGSSCMDSMVDVLSEVKALDAA